MHTYFGNSARSSGYSCLMEKLVSSWRTQWSAEPGTTDPNAPFGVVTLAPSVGEGGADLPSMRWAQTASYGVLPNPAMPNTFVAQVCLYATCSCLCERRTCYPLLANVITCTISVRSCAGVRFERPLLEHHLLQSPMLRQQFQPDRLQRASRQRFRGLQALLR
jgi:hypothetical protein